MLNKYLIATKNSVYLKGHRYLASVPHNWVAAFAADLRQFGYSIDANLYNALLYRNEADFTAATADILRSVRELVGAHVRYTPLFKNFPHDVPEDLPYLIRRLIGYHFVSDDGISLSCGCSVSPKLFDITKFGACPICQMQVDELGDAQKFVRTISISAPKKVLTFMGYDGLKETFQNIICARSSISTNDREFITRMLSDVLHINEYDSWLPKEIPFKENAGLVLGEILKRDAKVACSYASQYIHTATDILRLVVQLSGGDVSLATPSKIKLNNLQRKFVMAVMNLKLTDSSLGEMKPYRTRWLRVAEVLHYGCYQARWPNMYRLVDTLQNRDSTIQTFNSKVHALLPFEGNKGNLTKLVKLLQTRPGLFARRLNELLTKFDNPAEVATAFAQIADQLPIKLLLQLEKYFNSRDKTHDFRYFMPKGSVARMHITEDNRVLLNHSALFQIGCALRQSLFRKLHALPNMGKVYIDPVLKNFPIPFNQRSASKTSNPMIRGARIPYNRNAAALRLFMYWKQNKDSGRIDVDLSAAGYDENFNFRSHISWTYLSNAEIGVHSGDIQSAPNGASEFIDINLDRCRKNGIRYIAANVYSFTSQTYDTFECFAGIMEKMQVNIDEHYNPLEVKIKFDLTTKNQAAIPLIIDLETSELIWADLAGSGRTLEGTIDRVTRMCQVVIGMRDTVPSLYDLFQAHVTARGELCDDEKEANLVLCAENSVYNIDSILSEYL